MISWSFSGRRPSLGAMPQMSPTTSLQMELTRSALRRSRMASWEPGTFRAAME